MIDRYHGQSNIARNNSIVVVTNYMVREAMLIWINSLIFISRFYKRKLYVRFCCAVDVNMVDFICVSVS